MKKLFLLILIIPVILIAGNVKIKKDARRLWQKIDEKGNAAFQNHEIEKACGYWQRVISENPKNIETYNKLGIAYLVSKRYEEAADVFERGLKINDKNAALNYNLSLAFYYSGEISEALRQLENVLKLNSFYPEAYYLKGLCLEQTGRIEEAQAAYIEELNHNPGSRLAWQKIRK